ncbi:putative mitochondrial import inner membrane translocase subunit Tim17 [Babesia divergens]|uniref:Mitochondrial import inner membrane translocase subunit TIM22 n=1 Tax=Babesia divergens TaxID=32595 RepID=A0AAD9GDE5_BABDI|nr:putative mitochondrial import inner membrane translocase subunit Tim17 [Babesia divergens]
MEEGFDKAFLSDRYINYGLLRRQLSPEEATFQSALQIQQRVHENCVVRASFIGLSSAVIGGLVGTFFFSVQASNAAHTVAPEEARSIRSQIAAQYRQLVPVVKSSARNFAKIGFIYSMFECFIQKYRATSDVRNSIYAGCSTGGLLALKNGPIATAGGCIGFAAFSGLIDKYQQSHR